MVMGDTRCRFSLTARTSRCRGVHWRDLVWKVELIKSVAWWRVVQSDAQHREEVRALYVVGDDVFLRLPPRTLRDQGREDLQGHRLRPQEPPLSRGCCREGDPSRVTK